MQEPFDLAIVGGGPAGSACALTAARFGLTVALFEAQPMLCDKPCGEGLMPPGVDALRELLLHDVLRAGLPFRKLRYVLPGADPLEIRLPRAGLAIDRPHLTRGLENALQRASGIERHFGRVDVEKLAGADSKAGFEIASHDARFRARVLVVADGVNGKCAPWLRGEHYVRGSRERAPRLGVRARYTAVRPLDAVEVHFGRDCEVYLTPLPEDRINVAVLVSDRGSGLGGCLEVLNHALSEHALAAGRLGTRVTEPEARILGSRLPARVANEGTFLIGDAGGGIDPILGCGVTLALESGMLAAHAARRVVDGDASGAPERTYARAYRKRTHSRRALAAFLLAVSKRPLLARGTIGLARRAPGVVESLVGVAAGGLTPHPVRQAAG